MMAAGGYADLDPAFTYEGLTMRIGCMAGKAHAVEQRRFGEHNQFAPGSSAVKLPTVQGRDTTRSPAPQMQG